MACGGLFDTPSVVHHAPSSLLFALLAHEAAAELGLRLRAGIHCGSVTSGLIGATRGALLCRETVFCVS